VVVRVGEFEVTLVAWFFSRQREEVEVMALPYREMVGGGLA
jgi:hypothetical protein